MGFLYYLVAYVVHYEAEEMIIYFSGTCMDRKAEPEAILRSRANVMLSFYDSLEKRQPRFLELLRERRKVLRRKGKR